MRNIDRELQVKRTSIVKKVPEVILGLIIEASLRMSPIAARGNPQFTNGPQKCLYGVNLVDFNIYCAEKI